MLAFVIAGVAFPRAIAGYACLQESHRKWLVKLVGLVDVSGGRLRASSGPAAGFEQR
jgi:hypothetical protein